MEPVTLDTISSGWSRVQAIAKHKHTALHKGMRHGRWYLLKGIATPYAADEAHRQMLHKEFATLMRLNHPGIVQAVSLEDVPEVGLCIIMEWVEGQTLEQRLADGCTPQVGRSLLGQLLDVVEYVHQAGVVHRDLKPSNVMITRLGNQVKLIDFGLADDDGAATFKHAAGTEGYTSPKQAAGGVPDVRNDIYSLGVIIEQMPLGRRYARVVARCKDDLAQRPASVAQLREALERADKLVSWRRRFAIGGVAIILALGTLFYITRNTTTTIPAPHEPSVAASDSAPANPTDIITPPVTTVEAPPATTVEAPPTPTPSSREDRTAAVEQAIDEGNRRIKAGFPSARLTHHLDTLSDPRYIDLKETLVGLRIANAYIEEIKPRFSESEMATISNALYTTSGTVSQAINKRIEEIRKRRYDY